MRILSNAHVRYELGIDIVCCLLFLGISFLLPHPFLWILLLGSLLTLIHLIFSQIRYRKIQKLSRDLHGILVGSLHSLSNKNEEGELAILDSEIRKMTQMLQMQSELLAADKKRLTEAIADIAHQLRTPLTSMHLNLSLIARSSLNSEEQLSSVHDIQRQLDRMQWLIESLLKLSKLDAGTAFLQPKKLPIQELIDAALAPLLIPIELHEQNLQLFVQDGFLNADPRWTGEAISNLIKNAMEHTPQGGTITVSGKETALYTQILVEDTGNGFSNQDLSHLFERFYKGKGSASDNVGIGLALSRKILSSQNATLSAENRREGGARFIVKFYKTIV